MTWRAWNVRGRLSKLRAPTVCSHLHSCSQYCRLVDFGLCALAKHSPRSSLNLQQGCIRMTQVTHNCACTAVYIQCNGLSIYSAVFESTYGCYPTKWQLGQKLLLLIWHANDCFSSTTKHIILTVSDQGMWQWSSPPLCAVTNVGHMTISPWQWVLCSESHVQATFAS